MSKEDFAHGVEKASYIYQSVINEYVAENAKLKQLVSDMWTHREALPYGMAREVRCRMDELGIEVDDDA